MVRSRGESMISLPFQTKAPPPEIFSVGKYTLGGSIDGLGGLVEFSPAEYAAMGRRFVGEKNYNALPVTWLGRPWEVMVQTVHGRISAIAPHSLIANREAAAVFQEVFRFCEQTLGEPVDPQPNFCFWQVPDGTVVLRSEATPDGTRIGLVLTSNAALKFPRL